MKTENVKLKINGRRAFPAREILSILFLAIFTASLLYGCANPSLSLQKQPDGQISETRLLLDTFCTITIYSDADPGLLDEAFELCAEYEALLSITVEGSDVWRVNHAGGEPVTVDPRTIELIQEGLEFGGISSGMFDITIGRLSRLWDFGAAYREDLTLEPTIPAEAELEAARVTVDYRKVSIDGDTVQLADPGAWLDLGAIAKGYIADKIAGFLTERGVTAALIDLGGDIVTLGSKQDGSPWRIAVREPFGEMDDYLGVIEIPGEIHAEMPGGTPAELLGETSTEILGGTPAEIPGVSVISSGVYERQFEKDGVLYHHILDPNTGMPVKSNVISATVLTENAVAGEGLSTTMVLLGSSKIQELLYKFPGFIGAVLVLDSGEVLELGDVRFIG